MRGTPADPDTEADPAAGNRKPESIYRSHDGKEKEMQEKKLVELLNNLMSVACDNCKKIEGVSKEKADEICEDCSAGDHLCAILNENNRYSQIILCSECEYYHEDNDCQGGEFAWCRLDRGLDGDIGLNDGCSRGVKVSESDTSK